LFSGAGRVFDGDFCFPGDRAYEVIGNSHKDSTCFLFAQRELVQSKGGIFHGVHRGVFHGALRIDIESFVPFRLNF
jgi:hypothetical protein